MKKNEKDCLGWFGTLNFGIWRKLAKNNSKESSPRSLERLLKILLRFKMLPWLKYSFKPLSTMHRGAFCQFPFRWIYSYGSNKSTGKETGKTHLCAMWWNSLTCLNLFRINNMLWIVTNHMILQHVWTCLDSIWYELLQFIWFSNMFKHV